MIIRVERGTCVVGYLWHHSWVYLESSMSQDESVSVMAQPPSEEK